MAARIQQASRLLWTVLGAIYLASVWLDGVGMGITDRLVPQPGRYFIQVAGLFTTAASMSIDYRAEAWLCDERTWVELDTRPYFAINRDDKENRFYRALHFYRRHRETMQALEQYLLVSHLDGSAADGLAPRARVGGVRFLSLRKPIPTPGAPVRRWHRDPLAERSRDERKPWYWTPPSKRRQRCGGSIPTRDEDR